MIVYIPEGTEDRADAYVDAARDLLKRKFPGADARSPETVLAAAQFLMACAADIENNEMFVGLEDFMEE